MVDVEDGAEQEFGLVEGVGKVSDVGQVAVRHAHDVENAEAGLGLGLGAAAVVEVFFVGVEVLGGGVGAKMSGVGREVELLALEGVVGGREVGALGGGDGFGENGGLEQGGDVGQG